MPAAQLIGPLQHMLLISHIAMSGPSECHCYLSDCQQSLLIQPALMSFVQNHSLLCPENLLMPAVARWPPIWHILPKCSSSLSLSLPHTQTHTLTKTLHTGCPAYAPVAVKRGGPATNNPSRKKSSTHHSPVVLISGRNILKHRVRLFQISFYLNWVF